MRLVPTRCRPFVCLLAVVSLTLALMPSARAAQSNVQNGRIYVNGKLVFPFGFYHVSFYGTAAKKLTDMQTLGAAGFNLMDPSLDTTDASFLSAAATAGVNIMPEFNGDPGTLVNLFKSSPGIMGWACCDDADSGKYTPAQVTAKTALVKSIDPNHITYISCGTKYANFLNCSDIVGLQIYPIGSAGGGGNDPLWLVDNICSQAAAAAAQYNRPLLCNVQCSAVYNGIVPTPDEVRNMSYQAVINGIQGILYYCYYDGGFDMAKQTALWNGMKLLPPEIKTLTPVMTAGTRTKVSTGAANTLCAYWRYNSQIYVVVINTSYSTAASVAIPMPSDVTGTATPLFANRPSGMTLQGGKLTGSIGPVAVHAYVLNTGTTTPPPPPVSTLPAPWVSKDIGTVGLAGSASASNGVFTVKGSGSDIWGAADAFQYVYQPLNGDGEIVARVASIQNTNTWAKAGVMIRNTLTADSMMAMSVVSASSGTAFQYRTATGGLAGSVNTAGTAPYWVKLNRQGSTFTSSVSADGKTWTTTGKQTIAMNANVYAGLCVTAHNNTVLNTSAFDSITVTTVPVDSIPPAIAVTSVVLKGTADGTGSAIASVTVNSQPAAVSGNTWQIEMPVVPGTNTFNILITDKAGLSTSDQAQFVN